MYYTTKEYRDEMRNPFRGASYVYAYIGLINNDAQRSSEITSSFTGSEEHLYDGSSLGTVTSTENDGSITFTFGDYHELNIAGLMIEFNSLPDSVTVTNGSKSGLYSVTDRVFTIDDGYTDCHYLKITPNTGKLSITSITFGIGLQFTNKQIISTNRHNIVDHISNDLPSKEFTLVVDNRLHMFNKDNPYGYSNFLQEMQEIRYDYGRELSDGSIYKIKGGRVYLSKWSSDDYQARFSCVGRLNFIEGQYYKGKIYDNGISAYDLALDVFSDAGISDYKLDPSLKRVQIFNPLPICSYPEALKMIANASRCILFEDRDGNICIKNSNLPSFIVNVEFAGATDYCIPNALFDDNSLYNYADSEHDYVLADGSLLFLPNNDSYRQVGFVSNEIADANGHFSNNPNIKLSFVSEYSLKKLVLNFAYILPTSITIISYLNGTEVDNQTLSDLTLTSEYFYEGVVDEIIIYFNGANPNQRIHLNNVSIIGKLDYEITYHELKDTPSSTSLARVSKINVHSYQFNKEVMEDGMNKSSSVVIDRSENTDGGTTVDISTSSSVYGSAVSTFSAEVGNNLITFSEPYYNYKVSSGTIIEYGAYYIVVNSETETEINVFAQPYSVSENIYSMSLHEKGVEKDSKNPLISSKLMAMQQSEWLKDYYDDDLEYTLTYRGDPIIDADDLLYLENNFVSNNEIRVSEESISTSTGMDFNCQLIARRNFYQVNATTENAIVGRTRTGEVL